MKHTKTLTALTLCAALLLSGCSTGTPAETSVTAGEVTTTTTAEVTTFVENTTTTEVTAITTTPKTTADNEASEVRMTIDLLLEQNIECYQIFTYIAFDEVEKIDGNISRIGIGDITTYDILCDIMYDTYTEETARNILEMPGLDVGAMFFGDENALYVDWRNVGVSSYITNFDSYWFELDSVTDTECSFTLYLPFDYECVSHHRAVLTDNGWRLTEMFGPSPYSMVVKSLRNSSFAGIDTDPVSVDVHGFDLKNNNYDEDLQEVQEIVEAQSSGRFEFIVTEFTKIDEWSFFIIRPLKQFEGYEIPEYLLGYCDGHYIEFGRADYVEYLFIYDDTLCTYGSEFQFGYGGHDYYIQEYREYDLNTGEKTLEYREEYHDGDLSEPYVAYPDIRDTSVFGSFKDVQEYMHTKTDKLYMVLWYGIR